MSFVDPDQFIITRKRKKYKFALFANSPICYEFNDWTKRHIDVVEIGAGTGIFSVELALRHPEWTFLALDVKADRLQKGAHKANELGLTNIYFLRARADQIGDIVEPGSLQEIWLTFPDPYPKKRASGRRLTHRNFLQIYRGALSQKGTLNLKHDNLDFFCWSLEQIVLVKARITALSFDLHESSISTDAKTLTTYEQRWMSDGRITKFMQAIL